MRERKKSAKAVAGERAPTRWLARLGWWLAAAVLLLPPFVVLFALPWQWPKALFGAQLIEAVALGLRQPFRLPKLLSSELLVLGSLACLGLRELLARRSAARWRAFMPALKAVAPFTLVATLTLLSTAYQEPVREAVAHLWIAALAVVLWAGLLPRKRQWLDWMLPPAAALALIGILQHFEVFPVFAAPSVRERLQMTSLAGSVGDLAGFLVLPSLLAQALLCRAKTVLGKGWAALVLVVSLLALVLSQTAAALGAVLVGSALFWWPLLRRRRRLLAAAATAVVVAFGLLVATSDRGDRLGGKFRQLLAGDFDAAFTGRLDPWRASLYIFKEAPLLGVGQGAFGAEYGRAKLSLRQQGVAFSRVQREAPSFGNAHSEPLEVLAELGLLGFLALSWGLWALALTMRRRLAATRVEGAPMESSPFDVDRALAIGSVAAVAALALVSFPFRMALTGYPVVALLAWLLADDPDGEASEAPTSLGRRLGFLLLSVVLVTSLVLTLRQSRDRLMANGLVHRIELRVNGLLESGRALPRRELVANIQVLKDMAGRDPSDFAIPLSIGSQYYLLGNASEARHWYERSLALEMRPETLINLSRAALLAGDDLAAAEYLEQAKLLDPNL